jgi:hypothetical protein
MDPLIGESEFCKYCWLCGCNYGEDHYFLSALQLFKLRPEQNLPDIPINPDT